MCKPIGTSLLEEEFLFTLECDVMLLAVTVNVIFAIKYLQSFLSV